MKRLVSDPATIDGILRDGADRARALAETTMAEVRKIVGFIR